MTPLRIDFSFRLQHPEEWRQQGMALLYSSEPLWHHSECSTPEARSMAAASLLGGYALENLLKAVRVKQLLAAGEPILIKRRLRSELTGHNLVALATAAGIPLARHEEFLLQRLTITIKWGGRYVSPLESGETEGPTMISTDRETIRLFAFKLEAVLDGQEPLSYDHLAAL